MSVNQEPTGGSDGGRRDETALLLAAKAGDETALDEIVESFRPLVSRVASRLHGSRGSEELDDLIQVGMVGLLEAVGRFDPERGPFAPYAAATVSGTIKRHFRDRSWRLRVSRGVHDDAHVVSSAGARLEGALGRVPSGRELAEATGLGEDRVSEVRWALSEAQPQSLQAPVGEEATELGEMLGGDDPGYGMAETRATIGHLGAGLDARDREILTRRFGLDQTQLEIADRVGVSQMQVSRRLRKMLDQMAGAVGAGRKG